MSAQNTDLAYYDEEPVDAGIITNHADLMRATSSSWLGRFRKAFGDREVRVLEIGSGTCVLATLLSNESGIKEIVCTDISMRRMQAALTNTLSIVDGQAEKLSQAAMDFNTRFPFEDAEFDVVICDAALHHARSMWFTLSEVNRVLKPSGVFIAQREAYLAAMTSGVAMRRLQEAPEFEAGVSENAYTPGQYEYYLKIAGFEVDLMPAEPSWKFRLLGFLNGLLFAKYTLWAEKRREPYYGV